MDNTFNFQEVVDAFSLLELQQFRNKINDEFNKRLEAEQNAIADRQNQLLKIMETA